MKPQDYRDLPPVKPSEMSDKPEKFSQSFLAKFDTCHRSALLYLRHKGGVQRHPLIRGEVFHRFAQEAVEYLVEHKEMQMPGDVARERMNILLREYPLPAYEHEALRLMAWNFAESTMIDPDNIVGIETMLELPVGDHIVRGKLDYAEINPLGWAEIEDYKTQLSIPKQDDVLNGPDGYQLRLYAAMFLFGKPEGEDFGLGQGINEVHTALSFPRYRNSDTGELVKREMVLTRTDLNDFLQTLAIQLDQIDAAFKSRKFQATDGAHCGRCPARSDCPLPDTLHMFPRIENREQAIEQAKWLDFTATDVRSGKKALRDWCDDNGEDPLIYNDSYAFSFRVQKSRSVNWKEVPEGADIKPDQVKESTATIFDRRKQTPEEKAERKAA